MKAIIFFCFFSAFTISFVFSQTDSVKVKFAVITPNITNEESIFVTGNNQKLGNWYPDVVKMNRIDDSTFTINTYLPTNRNIEYKFTKGSWSAEGLNTDGTVLSNYKLKVKKDTMVVHKILLWGEAPQPKFNGRITGNVEYINNFKTREELLPRDIIIWLPPGYYENKELRYPVLYMNDGQNIIDPATSFTGIDWQIDETADSLIKNSIIEPIIIVGVYNTKNRSAEYSESDTGSVYLDFIMHDLKPMIDQRFRTKKDAENTSIAGSSLGGLISFIIAWKQPNVFSKAACLSPALKIGKHNFVDNVRSYKGEKKQIQFYLDNGGIDLEDSLQAGLDEMITLLNQKGYKDGEDLIYFRDSTAKHTESAWAERSWRFLEYFYEKGN